MRNYYISNAGRLARKDNTLYLERSIVDGEGPTKVPIPVEDVDALYLYGELDINTKLLNFLAQKHIPTHVFNYYGNYSGTYYPREYLNSGYLLVEQVRFYRSKGRRLSIAQEFVRSAAHGITRNLSYYNNRGKDVSEQLEAIRRVQSLIDEAPDIPGLMGVEGRIRDLYYEAFDVIAGELGQMNGRSRRPPQNELNALMSFGNGLCYAACLSEIYRTQLNPTISYLHQPGERRFSLALDLSEIFKPLLVDRAIFRMVNRKIISAKHFQHESGICWLNEKGRKVFLQEWDTRLLTTIQHRRLGRKVSYKRLIRLECYKLIKHLTRMEPYTAFRAWW